jgi:PAS domain S-box-containing protein
MDSSIVPIALLSMEGSITYVNRAFLELWGYHSPDEVIGLPFKHFAKDIDVSSASFLSQTCCTRIDQGMYMK